MSNSKLNVAFLTLLLVVAIGFVTSTFNPAQRALADQRSVVEGQNVVVLMAVAPTEVDLIKDLTGKVLASTPDGITLDCSNRTHFSKSGFHRPEEYKAKLYVPWTSILYVKILD